MKERSDRSDMGGRTCSCVWDDSHRGEKSKVEGMEMSVGGGGGKGLVRSREGFRHLERLG